MAYRKYKLNEKAFSEITEESAYWIGFLMADGCVFEKCLHLSLAEKDFQHVEKFRHFLGSTHPIKIKPNNGFQSASFSVHSGVLVSDLAKFGVVKKKSSTAKVSKLENNRHFWRGVIDGDGSIRFDKRYNTPSLTLVGSQFLVKQFIDFVKSIAPTNAKLTKNRSIFQFVISGYAAVKVIEKLYEGCDIALDRKRLLAENALSVWDGKDKKKSELNSLTIKVGRLYLQGNSGLKIERELLISSSAVYEHLKRYEKLTGKKIPRRHKTRQQPTYVLYRQQGLCKDCGAKTAPNRARCEFHLQKARDYWRRKNNPLTVA